MEAKTAESSYHPYTQGSKKTVKIWKLGQGAHRGKTQTSEEGAGRLVPVSLRGTRSLVLQVCWENYKLDSAFAAGRNCCCQSEGAFPGMRTGTEADRKEQVPSCTPAWQPPSGSLWWTESHPQHHKAGIEG